MDINEFTIAKLKEAINKNKPKTVHVNKQTYDEIINQLNFKPKFLIINDFIPNNQAIIIDEEMKYYYKQT